MIKKNNLANYLSKLGIEINLLVKDGFSFNDYYTLSKGFDPEYEEYLDYTLEELTDVAKKINYLVDTIKYGLKHKLFGIKGVSGEIKYHIGGDTKMNKEYIEVAFPMEKIEYIGTNKNDKSSYAVFGSTNSPREKYTVDLKYVMVKELPEGKFIVKRFLKQQNHKIYNTFTNTTTTNDLDYIIRNFGRIYM